jgi:hypothetical protein
MKRVILPCSFAVLALMATACSSSSSEGKPENAEDTGGGYFVVNENLDAKDVLASMNSCKSGVISSSLGVGSSRTERQETLSLEGGHQTAEKKQTVIALSERGIRYSVEKSYPGTKQMEIAEMNCRISRNDDGQRSVGQCGYPKTKSYKYDPQAETNILPSANCLIEPTKVTTTTTPAATSTPATTSSTGSTDSTASTTTTSSSTTVTPAPVTTTTLVPAPSESVTKAGQFVMASGRKVKAVRYQTVTHGRVKCDGWDYGTGALVTTRVVTTEIGSLGNLSCYGETIVDEFAVFADGKLIQKHSTSVTDAK